MGPLDRADASDALKIPAAEEGVVFDDAAVDVVYASTQGYPFFLQEWAYNAWNVASGSRITADDVRVGEAITLQKLDDGFFSVRYNRCTPAEKRYLRAMAELGDGPYRSADVARQVGLPANRVGPQRDALIRKGLIWSPEHGTLAFSVPLFAAFMRRRKPTQA